MTVQPPASRDRDEWQVWLWNQPKEVLSRPQRVQLMQIMEVSYNNFDAFRVVGDLMAYRDLWRGVVMDRGFLMPDKIGKWSIAKLCSDLIKLRDVAGGHWNVDTLFVLTTEDKEAALKQVAAAWRADETGEIVGDEAGQLLGIMPVPDGYKVVTFWWD